MTRLARLTPTSLPAAAPTGQMTLWEHLDELRARVLRSVLALVIGTVIGLLYATPVLKYLQQPYGTAFTVLGPTGGVVAYFRVALLIGAVLAIPMVTFQGMMFAFPGLNRREKRFVLLSLPAVAMLFLTGAAFAWFVLMPPALGFLEGFEPTVFKPEWTADLYLNFVTALVFWMGVAFEMPLVFFVLSLLGLVSAGMLWRHWRAAIVGAAVAAALITPTVDPVNMALVMGPLLVLYLLSILLVWVGGRTRRG